MHLFVADKVENHGDYYMVNPHATEKYFSERELVFMVFRYFAIQSYRVARPSAFEKEKRNEWI